MRLFRLGLPAALSFAGRRFLDTAYSPEGHAFLHLEGYDLLLPEGHDLALPVGGALHPEPIAAEQHSESLVRGHTEAGTLRERAQYTLSTGQCLKGSQLLALD